MKNDLQQFVQAHGHNPSSATESALLDSIHSDLCPTAHAVFLKLLLVQAFVGTLTLLFCPQFDLSLTSNREVFHFFHHHFGYYGCMAACGALFLGCGALFAASILRPAEVRSIRRHRWLHFTALSGCFIGVFILLDAQVYLDIAVVWATGAIFAAAFSMETIWWLKKAKL